MASGTISGTITFRPSGIPVKVTTRRSSVAEAADMIAFAKPSWILMAAVASSAHRRSSGCVCRNCQSGCHVREFERPAVNRRASNTNHRGDIFTISTAEALALMPPIVT